MRANPVVLVVLALLVTIPAAAIEHVSVLVFPVVARTAGVGDSQWVSDLTVNNLMDVSIEVGLQFFPENQPNELDMEMSNRIELGPRETRVISDVLGEFFGYDENIKGFLLVAADPNFIDGNPDDTNIAGTTRTYNIADPAGTYGQSVPALPTFFPYADPVVATGARHDDTYRSNLGVVSLAMFQEIRVHYRILNPDGSVAAEGSRNIPRLSMRQWSFQQLGVSPTEGGLTVEVRLDEDDVAEDPCDFGEPQFMAYVSKVDSGTDDAEFIYAFWTTNNDCE
jgi:hypothetical protein